MLRRKTVFIDKNRESYARGHATNMRMGTVFMVFCLVLFIIFLFHLINQNEVAAKDIPVEQNIKTVADSQTAKVEDVEAEYEAMKDPVKEVTDGLNRQQLYRKKFEGCVVVGDSLTEGLSVYGWLPAEQVFSAIGASITNPDLFNSAAAAHPKVAFFAFGMNDMGMMNGDADAFVKTYAERIKAFAKASPDTKIYVCSISTPSQGAISGNSVLGNYEAFNKAIKKMCKDNKWTFVDITDILPKHPELYAQDGIHANTDYYPLWMDRMIKGAKL